MKHLEERREKLHSIVDEIIDKDVQTCQYQNMRLAEDLEKTETMHVEEDGKIQQMLTTFEKTTMSGLDIIAYYEKLSSLVETLVTEVDIDKYCDRVVYREGKVDSSELQRMIGEVTEVEKILPSPEQEDTPATAKKVSKFRNKKVREAKKISGSHEQSEQLLSEFRYKESKVYDIYPTSQNKAWIAYTEINEFTLLNKDGQVQDAVPNKTGNSSFFMLNDKEFISADFQNQVVVRISRSGKPTNILNTSPLLPMNVGQGLDGNILVVLTDENSFTRTPESQRKVVMLTPGGEVIHTYESGENRSPLLTSPARPTQNYNSNVCFVDHFRVSADKRRGNVCVFHEDGGLKFIYNGHDEDFFPGDICCDSMCKIIIINRSPNHGGVHIISSEGTFLRHLFDRDTSVSDPLSIARYKDMIWIGSLSGEVRVFH